MMLCIGVCGAVVEGEVSYKFAPAPGMAELNQLYRKGAQSGEYSGRETYSLPL